jgi:DNA-binding MarR family transcriptional regulator
MLGHDKSTLGVIASNLENRGLIKRSRTGTDKRMVQLELTAAGRKLLKKATPLLPPVRAALLHPFTEEESAEFLRLLVKFHTTFNHKVKDSIRADMPS